MNLIVKLRNFFIPLRLLPPLEELTAHVWMLNLVDLKRCDIAKGYGAAVGILTASLAKSCVDVYTVEPNFNAFRDITKGFAENHNAHFHNLGVYLHKGMMLLYQHQKAELDQGFWSTRLAFLKDKGKLRRDSFVEIEGKYQVKCIEKIGGNINMNWIGSDFG